MGWAGFGHHSCGPNRQRAMETDHSKTQQMEKKYNTCSRSDWTSNYTQVAMGAITPRRKMEEFYRRNR